MSKKSMYPMSTGQSSILPKVIGALVTIAVLALVVKHPAEAASSVKTVIDAVSTFLDGLSS